MNIEIAEKISPFSKVPGCSAIIPQTSTLVKIYPVKLQFYNLVSLKKKPDLEVYFNLKGPIKKFVVFQNIEKSFIEVFGFSMDGFIKYKIKLEDKDILFLLEKAPKGRLELIFGKEKERYIVKSKERFILPLKTKIKEIGNNIEKLSLGVNKAQDMELINRRDDLCEILPLWFMLGQKIPLTNSKEDGVATLFKKCGTLIEERKKEKVEPILLNIFKAGCTSIFSPMLSDSKHLGILDESIAI